MNVENWVNDRLLSLDPGSQPLPEADGLLATVKRRDMAARATRKRFTIIGSSAFITCAAMATVITTHHDVTKATSPRPSNAPIASNGPSRAAGVVVPEPAQIARSAAAGPPLSIDIRPTHVQTTAVATPLKFKEQGSASAPMGCEIYTDFECPPCARFWKETVPLLVAEYVDTGKMKITNRDFPLSQHKYARLAARYANAAGIVGKYQTAFNQIMATQSAWHQDGDLETPLAAVLSADEMEKVRALIRDSAEADESMLSDRALGADDHIEQTPSIVLVGNGHRQKVTGVVTFEVLKSYLDQMLASQ
jgi:protein-disulfide isomerase